MPTTKAQAKSILRWLKPACRRLHVDDWHITVSFGDLPDEVPTGSDASTFVATEADKAIIFIPDRFWTYDAREQRRILTHELLHLHVERLVRAPEALKARVASDVWETFDHEARREYERTIDNLARAFAPHMPKFKGRQTT